MLARVNGLHAIEALAKSFGKNPLQRIHRGLGYIERSFPEAKHLRQAAAVIRVFVGDENTVKMLDGFFNGRKTGQRFPFAQSGVHEESGALRLEQRDVSRAAGRQNGYPQADR
jgi:hypothetical protein